MSAISRRRGVATGQTKVARVAKDSAAKGAAGIKEKLLIPVTGKRQLQLELVLRRNIPKSIRVCRELRVDDGLTRSYFGPEVLWEVPSSIWSVHPLAGG